MAAKDTFSFETPAGNYDVYIRCKGCQTQRIALNIPDGTMEKIIPLSTSIITFDQAMPLPVSAIIATINNDSFRHGAGVLKEDKGLLSASINQTRDTVVSKIKLSQPDSLLTVKKSGADTTLNHKKVAINDRGVSSKLKSASILILSGLLLMAIILFIFLFKRRKNQKES
jgi:LPXTG-motif cell wall-anchored protein